MFATLRFVAVLCVSSAVGSSAALAEKIYGPGVTDTEIRLGQTMPYSGPASAYGVIGKAHLAYFEMINAQGGINGRKIRLISVDDGYSPPKTVEQTRRLVEEENVFAMFGSLGTAANTAVQKYLNAKRVPQVLISAAGMKWNDPKNYPWTLSFAPNQMAENRPMVAYLLKARPQAKIAVLYQNDDFGKDYLRTLKGLLPSDGPMIIAEQSYEATDPTVDSQIVALKSSGADTLFYYTSPKFGALALRKTYDIGWKPLQFINGPSSSIGAVLKPAGPEKAVGLLTAGFLKDGSDPRWQDDPGTREWRAWMRQYLPEVDPSDTIGVYGYTSAQAMVQVLRQCGDNLTRENLMKQAASLTEPQLPMLLPGVKVITTATDYEATRYMQLHRFDGARWVPLGE